MDITLSFTIPSDKAAKALEGYLLALPNNETAEGVKKYTDKEWVKESVRRHIISTVRFGLQAKANQEVVVPLDDTIVQ